MGDALMTEARTEAQAVADVMRALDKTEQFEVSDGANKATIMVVADGREARSLEPFFAEVRARPRRHKGFAELTTVGSFVQHCLEYHTDDTAVFVDDTPTAPSMRAVHNYHQCSLNEDGNPDPLSKPGFGDYGAVYRFPLSEEWQAWTAADGETMDQRAFAEFLEDCIVDVMAPENAGTVCQALAKQLGVEPAGPSKLLTLSRGLTVNVGSKVAEHRNLSTGEGQIAYETTHRDSKGELLRVPGLFAIAIPVFQGEASVIVPVRLRYRVSGGQIAWMVKLHQADVIIRRAIDAAVEHVDDELDGITVFRGRPS